MKRTLNRFSRIALCAAAICLCSLLRIPAPVPFTLTLFGVYLALFFLGGKYGTLAVVLYLALGLVGLPVFSGGASVFALLSPTGGYLVGLLVLALVFRLGEAARPVLFAALGTLGCYLVGALWYCLYSGTGLLFSLWVGVAPFVLFDALKLALACLAAARLKHRLPES